MLGRFKSFTSLMPHFPATKPNQVLLLGIYIVATIIISNVTGIGFAQNNSATPELDAERLKYEEELAVAMQPVQKRYATRLQSLQKRLSRKGDKPGATAVEVELERMGAAIAQQARYPIEGKWVVRYQNGLTRNYFIHGDGTIEYLDGKQIGKFTRDGQNVLVDFGDGKLERFYWNTVLVVEHYNPAGNYGTIPPTTTGYAEKAP